MPTAWHNRLASSRGLNFKLHHYRMFCSWYPGGERVVRFRGIGKGICYLDRIRIVVDVGAGGHMLKAVALALVLIWQGSTVSHAGRIPRRPV